MRILLTILAIIALGAVGATAGCGVKTTNTGTLKSYDADAMAIVVTEGAKEVNIEITGETTGAENLEGMVGKDVKVISEHGKADSVEAVTS